MGGLAAIPGKRLIALSEWKDLARVGKAPENVRLRKAYLTTVERELDPAKQAGERAITFTISTSSPDRERDSVAAEGWQLANYLRNPVVLWAHDYKRVESVLGRALSVELTGGGLRSRAQFMGADLNPIADRVYQMLLQGFLNASSVGFSPDKWAFNETRGGFDFLEQELLEYSVVPIPANPEALVEARGSGIDVEPLARWAKTILLDLGQDGDVVAVERKTLEAALAALERKTVAIPFAIKSGDGGANGSPVHVCSGCTARVRGEASCSGPSGGTCPIGPYQAIESCPATDCPIRGENNDKPGNGQREAKPAAVPVSGDEIGLAEIESHALALDDDRELTADEIAAAIREGIAGTLRTAADAEIRRLTGRID